MNKENKIKENSAKKNKVKENKVKKTNIKKNKENKKGKNVKLIILKVILAILILFLIFVIGYEISIQWETNLDKSNPMTKDEVIALLEKGKEYSNYYYSSETKVLFFNIDNDIPTQTYVKDKVVNTVVGGKTLKWENANTDERIWLAETDEGDYAFISKKSEADKDLKGYDQQGFDYSLLADEENFDYDFEYLGEKEIDGREYVLVKCWNRKGSKLASTKFVIDKETGLIAERRDNALWGIIVVEVITNRNVQTDIVADEDIARPDLSNYTVIESENH